MSHDQRPGRMRVVTQAAPETRRAGPPSQRIPAAPLPEATPAGLVTRASVALFLLAALAGGAGTALVLR